MLDKDTAVELASRLAEAGIDVEVSVRPNLRPAHPTDPSPTAWVVKPRPALDLNTVVKIANKLRLTAWIGHGGGSSIDFRREPF